MEADGQNVAGLDAVARRLLAHAIDADMAGLDQRGSAGAGLHHPRVPQPFVETLALQATPLENGSEPAPAPDRVRSRLSLETALAILAVGGELLLERSQFGKRRIGVYGALAFARAGARGVLPVRGPAIGALVASAFFAAALVAAAAKFALVPVRFPALVLVPALKALARLVDLVLARFANRRRAIGARGRHALDRCIGTGVAE